MEPKEFAVILQRAATLVGGVEPLRVRLNVSPDLIERWLEGRGKVPPAVFLKTIDILLEALSSGRPDREKRRQTISQSRQLIERAEANVAVSLNIARENAALRL